MRTSARIQKILLLSGLAVSPLAQAQSPLSSILGAVTDQSHTPAPNAAVTVTLAGKNYIRKTVTGTTGESDGAYTLPCHP